MLQLRAKMDLGATAIKGYSAFPKALALQESHHQIVECHIQDTRWGSFTSLQRCSWCILQSRLIGPEERGGKGGEGGEDKVGRKRGGETGESRRGAVRDESKERRKNKKRYNGE